MIQPPMVHQTLLRTLKLKVSTHERLSNSITCLQSQEIIKLHYMMSDSENR